MQDQELTIDELIAKQKPGFALGQRFYTDPLIYALEQERVLARNWILAGHRSELPETGDFKVFKLANESAIVVRGGDGELKAFANVCRHRGSLVCLESQGHADKFTCPYHGWTYGIDGGLIAARSTAPDFESSEYSLNKIALEEIGGLIFLCFSDNPPSVASARREMADAMGMFGFENLKVAACKEYEIPANWKLAIENYEECYHCASAHPEYAVMHTLMVDHRRRGHLQKNMIERIESCGLKNLEIDKLDGRAPPGEMGYSYSRTALFEGYKTGSKEGLPVAPLLGELTDYDGGASDFAFGQFSFLLVYSDHAVVYVFFPIDHENCKCVVYWMVRGDAEEGKDYDVDKLTWLWEVTTHADKEIVVNNAKGIKSRYYKPGPFSEQESAERSWVEWLLSELARP
jgi:phenylpropionate dioxygenase-like ring-hydroxylating dioxygenase large terminal subunit